MNNDSSDTTPAPPTSAQAQARFALVLALPAAILVAGYLPFLLYRSQLPDRVASHFDGAGRPDDSMTVGVFVGVTSVLIIIGIALLVGLGSRRRAIPQGIGPMVGFLGGFLGGMGAGILGSTVITQRNIDDWTEADNIWMTAIVTILLALAAGAGAAWFGAQLATLNDPSDASNSPVMDLAEGEQAVWVTTLHSVPLYIVGACVFVAGLVFSVATTPWTGLVTMVVSVPMIMLATLRVQVDRAGLRVAYGILPWPKTHVGIDRIETATVIDVRPMRWGGWGYRGSLTLMRQAAVVHRAGPGIRLDLKDGKVFVVTVDDPETGVALLNAQILRITAPA